MKTSTSNSASIKLEFVAFSLCSARLRSVSAAATADPVTSVISAFSRRIYQQVFRGIKQLSAQRMLDELKRRGLYDSTLIVVTADHETGGLSVTKNNGRGKLPEVDWASKKHTPVDVPIYALPEVSDLIAANGDAGVFLVEGEDICVRDNDIHDNGTGDPNPIAGVSILYGDNIVIEGNRIAAVGAAIAMGHPVTVIAAFVAAPLTSLNPMIAAGWVSGLVEAFSRKPKVKDFERLPDDILSIKGFWRNKVTRILLVVVFTNLGSAAGTFVAIPMMMKYL